MSVSKNIFSKDLEKSQIYKAYFVIINGLLKLTPKELDIVSKLYYYTYEISKSVKDEKLQGVLLFSTEYKKKIADELSIDNLLLNNYISSLKKKGVILVEDNTEIKWVNPRFTVDLSKDSVQIVFNLNSIKDEIPKES